MRRSKKLIVAAVLTAVVLAGSISGIVYAQTGSRPITPGKTLFARVATILNIDQQKLENAFAQAQSDMQKEALDNQLKSLVDQGKMTQQQADQYKAWVNAKPTLPSGVGLPAGPGGPRHGAPPGFRAPPGMPPPGAPAPGATTK